MKWIDDVIDTKSYTLLKVYTNTAVKHSVRSFKFMGEQLETSYAIILCKHIEDKIKQEQPKTYTIINEELKLFKNG